MQLEKPLNVVSKSEQAIRPGAKKANAPIEIQTTQAVLLRVQLETRTLESGQMSFAVHFDKEFLYYMLMSQNFQLRFFPKIMSYLIVRRKFTRTVVWLSPVPFSQVYSKHSEQNLDQMQKERSLVREGVFMHLKLQTRQVLAPEQEERCL